MAELITFHATFPFFVFVLFLFLFDCCCFFLQRVTVLYLQINSSDAACCVVC